MSRTFAMSLALIAGSVHAVTALAQCPNWNTDPSPGSLGVNGSVDDQVVWDRDGNGPLPPVLVVTGTFTVAGNSLVSNIAMWDGTNWFDMAGGIDDSGRTVEVFNGDLYVGGEFQNAGGTPAALVARFDGTSWHAVDNGMVGTSGGDFVHALTVFDGKLYAGGQFTQAGSVFASRVASYDGTAWSPLTDSGFGNGVAGGTVLSFGSLGSSLVIGGNFTSAGVNPASRVVTWNGTDFAPLAGVNNQVTSITTFGGELVIGGRFTSASNPGGTTPINGVARWTGSAWEQVGNGLTATLGARRVEELTTYNGELIAAGNFQKSGTTDVIRAARWNGTEWLSLGGAINSPTESLAIFNGQLHVGGRFTIVGGTPIPSTFSFAGGLPVQNLARWDGTAWNGVSDSGFGGIINAMGTYNGSAVAVGQFTGWGNQVLNRIGIWNGQAWLPFGDGFNNAPSAVTEYAGQLVATGPFTHSGTNPLSRIAVWNGTTWTGLGAGLDNGGGAALASNGTDLYVGGPFFNAGGVECNGVAKWNGSAWESLDGGVDNAGVNALLYTGGTLYVGGTFTTAGSSAVTANAIATWNGTAWSTLGGGFAAGEDASPGVLALAAFDGGIVAAGTFTQAGEVPAMNIAKWNGTDWEAMGAGLGEEFDSVLALAVKDGVLYAAGQFSVSGPNAVLSLARWNPTLSVWEELSMPGINGPVFGLAAVGGELHVGGSFTTAGGELAHNWVRWSSEPVFAVQPVDVTSTRTGSATFSTIAAGAPTLAYAWRRNGVALVNGPQAGGTIVNGATTATLSLTDLQLDFAGNFDVVVTNGCGPSTSATAVLTINACNTIDFNNNGVFPEDQDVIDFFDVLAGGTPATCDPAFGCQDIDFNNNEVFPEDQDVIDFFNVLAGGTCA